MLSERVRGLKLVLYFLSIDLVIVCFYGVYILILHVCGDFKLL